MSVLKSLKPVDFTADDEAVIASFERAERSEQTRREIAKNAVRYIVGNK